VIRRLDLVWVVLAVVAVVLGIWLGLSGVDISPIFTEVPSGVGAGGPGR
jgi:hypothetical protein